MLKKIKKILDFDSEFTIKNAVNDLKIAFEKNSQAHTNFKNFTHSQRKSYLYWLNQAKLDETRQKRIAEIIKLCDANIKSRSDW